MESRKGAAAGRTEAGGESATSAWRERLASGALRRRLAELERQDAEVRLLRLLLGEHGLFQWALSIGTLRDPGLRALAPPLPPEPLRRITADDAPELFLWTGLADVENLLQLWQRHGSAAAGERPRVLDFGCGCGRLLRFLTGHGDLFELHGADVNPAHVDWCRTFLAPIAFETNAPVPPLSYRERAFDCVWSLSVFTHLDEGPAARWRAELARVLAPGGLLIATTHGATALARFEVDPERGRMTDLDAERFGAIRRSLAAEGFAFVPYDGDALAAARAGESYGLSFASAEHVGRRWVDERFELVAHLPGGLRGWQDIVVLRRR